MHRSTIQANRSVQRDPFELLPGFLSRLLEKRTKVLAAGTGRGDIHSVCLQSGEDSISEGERGTLAVKLENRLRVDFKTGNGSGRSDNVNRVEEKGKRRRL